MTKKSKKPKKELEERLKYRFCEEMPLSVRLGNSLYNHFGNNGKTTLGDILSMSEEEMLEIKGIGKEVLMG